MYAPTPVILFETAGAFISPYPSFVATLQSPSSPSTKPASPPHFLYTSRYRHLLAIRSTTGELDSDDDNLQKFSSTVQKEWSGFMDSGFKPPDQDRPKFDLTESDRQTRRRKHETIDWLSFDSGFSGRETFLDADLSFDAAPIDPTSNEDLLSAEHKRAVAAKARAFEQSPPPFDYDITPREERAIQVDRMFFEVFSDVLCSSDWTRDEMKESNWVLVQYRTRPKDLPRPPSLGNDGRSTESWFLVEEIVPPEYQASLLAVAGQQKPKASRRISFMRAVRKKTSKTPSVPQYKQQLPPLPPSSNYFDVQHGKLSLPHPPSRTTSSITGRPSSRSSSPALRLPDDALFMPGSGGPPTKVVTLSNSLSSGEVLKSIAVMEDEFETLAAYPSARMHPPIILASTASQPGKSSAPEHEASNLSRRSSGIGYTRPSPLGTGNRCMDIVRKTTHLNVGTRIPGVRL